MTLNGYIMSNSDFVPAVLFFGEVLICPFFFYSPMPLSSFPSPFPFPSGPIPYIPLEVDSDGSRLQQRESFPFIPSLSFPFPFTPVHPIPSFPLSYLLSPFIFLFLPLPSPTRALLPLEVGPLKSRYVWGRFELPSGVSGGALAEIELGAF